MISLTMDDFNNLPKKVKKIVEKKLNKKIPNLNLQNLMIIDLII